MRFIDFRDMTIELRLDSVDIFSRMQRFDLLFVPSVNLLFLFLALLSDLLNFSFGLGLHGSHFSF